MTFFYRQVQIFKWQHFCSHLFDENIDRDFTLVFTFCHLLAAGPYFSFFVPGAMAFVVAFSHHRLYTRRGGTADRGLVHAAFPDDQIHLARRALRSKCVLS